MEEEKVKEKKLNNFIVKFSKDLDLPEWTVKRITKPKLVEGEWSDIKIIFQDLVEVPVVKNIYNLIEHFEKSMRTKTPNLSLSIIAYDNDDNPIEEWKIDIDKIVSIDFGNGDSESEDQQLICLVLKPRECVLK